MAKLSLTSLGTMLKDKRRDKGIREVAAEIGVSSATLSRIENGKIPDLKTFSKICNWLQIDPSEVLGCKGVVEQQKGLRSKTVLAHLRADKDLDKETLQALTEMILRARTMISERIGEKQ
jgi:transcriptional regulator with XRE-family HTH domain